MGDCVATEETEDVGVVLFDAVFAIDEDEGSTESRWLQQVRKLNSRKNREERP